MSARLGSFSWAGFSGIYLVARFQSHAPLYMPMRGVYLCISCRHGHSDIPCRSSGSLLEHCRDDISNEVEQGVLLAGVPSRAGVAHRTGSEVGVGRASRQPSEVWLSLRQWAQMLLHLAWPAKMGLYSVVLICDHSRFFETATCR